VQFGDHAHEGSSPEIILTHPHSDFSGQQVLH
jgi:hypothetical protein